MRKQAQADLAMTTIILCLGASLVFAGYSLLGQQLRGDGPSEPWTLETLIGALAAGAGIAIALWWTVSLAIALLSTVAQLRGNSRFAALTASWSPAFMRRLMALILGLNLLSMPMAIAAPVDNGPIDPQWNAIPVATAPSFPDQIPTAQHSVPLDETSPLNPAWTPSPPSVEPGPVLRPVTRPIIAVPPRTETYSLAPLPVDRADTSVVVQRGDTLWSIAAQALGPFATDLEIAEAWPQWYRYNRAAIGANPDIIMAGQILHAPLP